MSRPVVPQPIDRAVNARFYVERTEHFNGTQRNVHLSAVSRGDQNKQWSSATPVGNLTMTINNPGAAELIEEWMKAGIDVEITLRPVPVLRPDDGHPFRQSDDGDPRSYYSSTGLCGDCGGRHADA